MVCVPAVARVAETVPAPRGSVLSAGSVAAASLLVKWTVPAYVGFRLPNASRAVTVKLNGLPAVADAGALIEKWVVAAAVTSIVLLVPVIELVTVSVAVIVCDPAVSRVAENVPVPLLSVASGG